MKYARLGHYCIVLCCIVLYCKKTAKSYGDRAFAKSGPELWNAHPLNIRSSLSVTAFKRAIKTHCYKLSHLGQQSN